MEFWRKEEYDCSQSLWDELAKNKDQSTRPKPRKSLSDFDIMYDYENNSGLCHEYNEQPNKCVTGHNMEKITDTTLDRCQYACSNTWGCKGIEFFKKSYSRNASDTYKEGDCNLNDSLDTVGCDPHKW